MTPPPHESVPVCPVHSLTAVREDGRWRCPDKDCRVNVETGEVPDDFTPDRDPGQPADTKPDQPEPVANDPDGPAPPPALAPPPRLLDRLRSGQIITPGDCEASLVAIVEKIDQGVGYQSEQERRLARLEEEYRTAYARALLAAGERSADLRKARAEVATEELGAELAVQRIVVKTTRDAMHNLRSLLSGVQSVTRSVVASYGAGGGPGDPRP